MGFASFLKHTLIFIGATILLVASFVFMIYCLFKFLSTQEMEYVAGVILGFIGALFFVYNASKHMVVLGHGYETRPRHHKW